jgi:NADH-quinone oxidoreductase subunit A
LLHIIAVLFVLLDSYVPIALFAGMGFGIAVVLLLAPFVVAVFRPDRSKLSPYECGIDPKDGARTRFDVKFFIVAIMFIIFDIEIVLLLPWVVSLPALGVASFATAVLFITMLTVGLLYEWSRGAMDY